MMNVNRTRPKRRAFLQALLVAVCALELQSLHAQAPSPEDFTRAIAASRAAVRALMHDTKVPGVSVAVALRGELVWNESFGFADREQKVAATIATKFGLGSITKSFTAALCARMVEEGKLDFDAPIATYLPEFPFKHEAVTAATIIAHLSGLNDEFGNAYYYTTQHFTTSAALQKLLRLNRLQNPPRTRHEYTTGNYTIVAAVIEKASGRDFSSAMQHYVLAPLGLQSTVFNDRTTKISNCTAFYMRNEKGVVKTPEYDPSHKWAGAGLLATAAEVAQYGAALLREGFLSARTREEIFRTQQTASGEDTGYALAWYVANDAEGRRMYHHAGGGLGISSYLRLYPQEECVLALLSNLTGAPVGGEVATKIAEAFLTRP